MNQLICKDHNSRLSYISTANKTIQLVCEECVLQFQEKNREFNLNDFINIQKATTEVQYFLNKTTLLKQFPTLFETLESLSKEKLLQEYYKLEESIKSIQSLLSNLQQNLKEYIKTIEIEIHTFQNELFQIIKYQEFKKIINKRNPKYQQQIVDYLYPFFQGSITNAIQSFIKNKKSEVPVIFKDLLLQIQKQTQEFPQPNLTGYDYGSFLLKDFLTSKLMVPLQLQRMQELAKLPKIKQVDLIYGASKNEFNLRILFEKIKGRKDIFMIFKNKDNQIFGGYSDQRWKKIKEQPDEQKRMNQFIFKTQPNLVIYGINPYRQNIEMEYNNEAGIFYGDGPDLIVNSDFCGQLRYNGILIGKRQPLRIINEPQIEMQKLIECEIYQFYYF